MTDADPDLECISEPDAGRLEAIPMHAFVNKIWMHSRYVTWSRQGHATHPNPLLCTEEMRVTIPRLEI